MAEAPFGFTYVFTFADGTRETLALQLEPTTLALVTPAERVAPAWAGLTEIGCPGCSLPPDEHQHCPVAANLAEVIERFSRHRSYEQVEVRVDAPERVYSAKTTLQHALSSLSGIIMVTSGCPVLDRLRPMVRFHLPFASLLETTYRATSMYLLGQFMRARRGLEPDWTLAGLEEIYRQVHQVNLSIARRVREAAQQDASANALVRLDLFTDGVAFSIRDAMQDLEHLFAVGYLDAARPPR